MVMTSNDYNLIKDLLSPKLSPKSCQLISSYLYYGEDEKLKKLLTEIIILNTCETSYERIVSIDFLMLTSTSSLNIQACRREFFGIKSTCSLFYLIIN